MIKNQTIQIQTEKTAIVRLILKLHFENDLHCFHQNELSSIEKPFTYELPKQTIWSINSFLNNVSDETILDTIQKTIPNWEIGKDIKETQTIFKNLLKSNEFKNSLNNYRFTDSYVFDKTTHKEYPVWCLGEHTDTIHNIIKLHKELNSIQKQDNFIINKLEIKGFSDQNDYYLNNYDNYRNFLKTNNQIQYIDKHKTILDYLELAEGQFNYNSNNETTKCYYVSYGNDNEWFTKTYGNWDEMITDLYMFSPKMVSEYFEYNPMAEFDLTNKNIKKLAQKIQDAPGECTITRLNQIADIERKTKLFLKLKH